MEIIISDFLKCRECGETFLTTRDRNTHINAIHNKTLDMYIIEYLFDNQSPICKCGCGIEVSYKFYKDKLTYSDYTKNHFPRNPHTDATIELIKQNTKSAINSKYGVDNVFVLRSIQNKIKETNQTKYGVDNPMKNSEIAARATHTQSDETISKIKTTNQLRYGANSYTASDIGKKNIEASNRDKYGVSNPAKLDSVISKTKLTNIKKYGSSTILTTSDFRKKYNNKNSKIEIEVCQKLNGEHKFIYMNKEYDIKLNNDVFEIDGDFYHPPTIQNLTFIQTQSIINDIEKQKIMKNSEFNLFKIHTSNIPAVITAESLKNNSYTPDYSIKYDTVIISKEYLKNYFITKGTAKLERYIPLLLKFIRTVQPEFPKIESSETIEDVVSHIHMYDTDLLITNDDEFNNRYHNTGVGLLKSHFQSYWAASYKQNPSPIEAWYNNDTLKRIISYRIGLNKDNDTFNFSLKQIITGLTVNRYSVSFFKPMVAAAIYRKYLGNVETPIVLDPCAGFGGRLLGFKAMYPTGTYIGVEPNTNTYNELKSLVTLCNFTNVELYNCKIEDFKNSYQYDLVFTSIPYFDLEDYKNGVEYADFDEWNSTFIDTLLTYDNLLLNMNITTYERVSDKFTQCGKLCNNKSPFNKSTEDNYELIVRSSV